jgi:hypothetical protein
LLRREAKVLRTDGLTPGEEPDEREDDEHSHAVTAVDVPLFDTGVAGHADGSVRAFRLLGST